MKARYDYDPYGKRRKLEGDPAPVSGSKTHRSDLVPTSWHQHYFYNATEQLPVQAGDKLVAWVYLDPLNPPREVMLQWNSGNWEHRAYWGENLIGWGVNNTVSRRNMGALPAAGGWVRLEVSAAEVGLEGGSLNGMAFTLFGGRAWWDGVGKRVTGASQDTLWGDDAVPAGASVAGNEGWTWVNQGVEADFAFTGHYYHAPSTLHLALYRAYDAEVGRWLSRDPIEEAGGLNLYGYVGGNPIQHVDRLGLRINYDSMFQSYKDILKRVRKCDPEVDAMIKQLEESPHLWTFQASHKYGAVPNDWNSVSNGTGTGGNVSIDPVNPVTIPDGTYTPEQTFVHELQHATSFDSGGWDPRMHNGIPHWYEEAEAVRMQNRFSKRNCPKKGAIRKTYNLFPVPDHDK